MVSFIEEWYLKVRILVARASLVVGAISVDSDEGCISISVTSNSNPIICCCSWVAKLCLFATPWTAACQASLSFTISWSLLRCMSIESVMVSNHLILYCPLLLSSIFPSIRVFSKEQALHIRWTKSWSFSFNNSPSNEYLGLISFRIDWFDFLAVQGTLKSLLQHHNLKASILQCSAFFID